MRKSLKNGYPSSGVCPTNDGQYSCNILKELIGVREISYNYDYHLRFRKLLWVCNG